MVGELTLVHLAVGDADGERGGGEESGGREKDLVPRVQSIEGPAQHHVRTRFGHWRIPILQVMKASSCRLIRVCYASWHTSLGRKNGFRAWLSEAEAEKEMTSAPAKPSWSESRKSLHKSSFFQVSSPFPPSDFSGPLECNSV